MRAEPGYDDVLAITDNRPEVTQASDEYEVVYAQAEKARDVLRNALADEWFVDKERMKLRKTPFYYPVADKKRDWVDEAIDPGVKGAERAQQKMKNDYGGHAKMLKDLARITLKYTSLKRMATARKELEKMGFVFVVTKNKYFSPTVRSELLNQPPPPGLDTQRTIFTADGLLRPQLHCGAHAERRYALPSRGASQPCGNARGQERGAHAL